MVKRHMRPQQVGLDTPARQTVGGVIEREGPIHVSNVMLLDPKEASPTRVRHRARERQALRVAKRPARGSTDDGRRPTDSTRPPA